MSEQVDGERYRYEFYGSKDARECLNCGVQAGELHTPECPCNDEDYDGDESWEEDEEE